MAESTPSRSQDDDPGGSGPLAVHVSDGGTSTASALIQRLGDALAQAGQSLGAFGEVRVRLVLDAEMAQSHEEFAGVPGTTDVLTFDMTDPEDDPIDRPTAVLRNGGIVVERRKFVDTDIMVCVDEAKRQGEARGHDVFHELLLYSVHGLLHCLGHDDHEETSYEAMHALEDAVLTKLGIGVVFGRPEASGRSEKSGKVG